MSNIIMLIPVDKNAGLFSISLGIYHIAKKKKINIQFFKFVEKSSYQTISSSFYKNEEKNLFEDSVTSIILPNDFFMKYVLSKQEDSLIELMLSSFYKKIKKETEIFFIQGLIFPTWKYYYSILLNKKISIAFHAKVILISSTYKIKKRSYFFQKIEVLYESFDKEKMLGIIFNKIIIKNNNNVTFLNFLGIKNDKDIIFSSLQKNQISFLSIQEKRIPILSYIPWNIDLVSIRVVDFIKRIDAKVLHVGKNQTYRINSIILCIENFSKTLENLTSKSLLIISADQHDILISICLLQEKEKEISVLLLVDDDQKIVFLKEQIKKYISYAKHIPIFFVKDNFLNILSILRNTFESKVPHDDFLRINKLKKHMEKYISDTWMKIGNIRIEKYFHKKNRMSPPEFRYRITELAKKSKKSIILPEGFEPRTIQAASICSERDIAHCILLGNPDKIKSIAKEWNISFGKNIDIIDPQLIRHEYIDRLISIRKNENMTEEIASKRLENNILLGTMMLEKGIVDGLVSGAIHTTADTIRPSLQIIKTAPKSSLVSSIFFMLFPNQVVIYGDCAINPNPNIEQLSEIAIQSADSAKSFGIEPYIAMISYSTGRSGYGHDVEIVRQATQLVQKKRPDLNIDGPLQYDAAMVQEVASLKAPKSPIAGRANILIFPDLNTGNTTYKAVQRSANLISIGPMLQGLRKPVNDLSRGALINDIVYTIALTVIQSTKSE